MGTRYKIKDKYDNEYMVEIDFSTNGLLPKDYMSENPTVNFGIAIYHNDKVVERYFTNTSSAVLMYNSSKFMDELDITRRVNRHGDRLAGKKTKEIKIDFKSHFDGLIQGLVDDFIKQFDSLSYEDRKQLVNDAMEDLEITKQSSIGVMGKIFENCTQIDNFLALDSTGALRKRMEEQLSVALSKDKPNIDLLFDREEDEYER